MKNLILFSSFTVLAFALNFSSARAQLPVSDVPLEIYVTAKSASDAAKETKTTIGNVALGTETLINAMAVVEDTQKIADAAAGIAGNFVQTLEGLNSKTLPFMIGQVMALESQGMMLAARPDGTTYVANAATLTYNPSDTSNGGFSGGNLAFMDNLIGARGVPVGMDNQPPVILVPLTKSQAAAFAPLIGNMPSNNYVSGPAMYFGNMPVDNAMQSIISSSLPTISSSMAQTQVGDGVFVRPYEGAHDDMYAAVGESALGANSMNYYANCQNYHPMMGHVTGVAGSWNTSILSNILSNNQFAAVSSYLQGFESGLQAKGTVTNPYQNFGPDMAPQAIQAMGQVPIGQPLTLTSQQIANAQFSASRLINTVYPNLFANMSQSDANYSPKMVAVVTLKGELAAQYYNAMRANNEAIRQNWMEAQKSQILVNHLSNVLNGANGSPGLLGIHGNLVLLANSTLVGDVKNMYNTIATNGAEIGRQVANMPTDVAIDGEFKNDIMDINDQLNGIGQVESRVLKGGPDIEKLKERIQDQISLRQQESSSYQNRMSALASERAKLLAERETLRTSIGKGLQQMAREQFFSALNTPCPVNQASNTTTGTTLAGQ